jgi:Mrp family chromosome partitioning ATPase
MPNISPVRHLYFALPRQHDTTIMVGLLCEASMRKILVTSPKGGCGKTTITSNMAVIAHLNGIRAGCEWKSVIGYSRFDDIKDLAIGNRYAVLMGKPFE